MSCSSCSIKLLPNAKFCHGCGKPAVAAAAAAPKASPTSPSYSFSRPSTTTTTTTTTSTSPFRSGTGAVSPATKAPLSSAAARQPTFGGQKFVSSKPTTTSPASSPVSTPSSGGLNPSRFGTPVRGPAPTASTTASAAAAARAEEERAKEAAAQKAKQEAEQRAKQEAEQRARQEAEQKARQQAEQKAKQEAEQKARQDAEQKAKQEADQHARQLADQKAKQEAEQKARQEAEQKAKQEAEQKAKQEAEQKAKQDAEHRARLASQSAPSVVVSPIRPAASQPVISRGAAPRAGPSDFRRGGLNTPAAATGNKRHSKINMDSSEIKESLAGLDVEGIQVHHEKPASTVSREAPVSSPSPASPSAPGAPARGGGLANRFAAMMAEKAAAEQAAERQKIRGRRKGATEFVDKQIRMLISILQGKGGSVLFGDLFRETADEMPALAATLAVAQKRGVVGFEGNMLMQGVHDKVKITLLRDEIEDSAVFVSVYGIAPIREVEAPKVESCHICNKTVYPTERVNASGKTMHKSCFRCCTCNGLLKLAQFAFNGGKFYCDTHFKELFASGGGKYNF